MMWQLLLIIVTLPLASSFIGQRGKALLYVAVSNGGGWGNWGVTEMCPKDYYAAGFSLKVEGSQGNGDDTALNGIRLYCVSKNAKYPYSDYAEIKSTVGPWGSWTGIQWCKTGQLVGFKLRVEPSQGNGDDTAANNIMFKCTGGEELIGGGTNWGTWGSWTECSDMVVCGIDTKIENPQGSGDDTALNDVHIFCCA